MTPKIKNRLLLKAVFLWVKLGSVEHSNVELAVAIF